MVTVAELTARMREATAETPYLVTDETEDGFTVRIDVEDPRWWGPLHRRSLSRTVAHVVRVDPEAGSYSVTDQVLILEWQETGEGDGGTPRPVLGGAADGLKGMNTVDPVEGNQLIDRVAIPLGLRRRMDQAAKVGLVVALVVVIGLLAAGVVLGGLTVTGVF